MILSHVGLYKWFYYIQFSLKQRIIIIRTEGNPINWNKGECVSYYDKIKKNYPRIKLSLKSSFIYTFLLQRDLDLGVIFDTKVAFNASIKARTLSQFEEFDKVSADFCVKFCHCTAIFWVTF